MDDTDDKNDKINKATKNNSVHSYSILEATIVLWLLPRLCIYILYTWLITLILLNLRWMIIVDESKFFFIDLIFASYFMNKKA